jgi:phospholipid/cholesterol/gamma-HCH transport system ATP-binding protein
MIKIEDLKKSFDGHNVLRGISFEVGKGEVFALVGGSGGGKSVLLKHVAGLMKPDGGSVTVDGLEIGTAGPVALQSFREQLGFLFQGGALFDSMNVFDNVAFPLKEKSKLSKKVIRERVMAELENVGLSGSEDRYPSQISGGMVKRAALARALVEDPEIMLFDEPTTGLDPVTGQSILKLIDDCHRRLSFTGIIVTHEIPKVFAIVDRVVMLHEGSVKKIGTPAEFEESCDPLIQAFLNG